MVQVMLTSELNLQIFPESLLCATFTKAEMMTMFGSQEVAPLVSNECEDWVEPCEIVVQVWNEAHNHASSKNSFVLNVNTFYQLLYWIVQWKECRVWSHFTVEFHFFFIHGRFRFRSADDVQTSRSEIINILLSSCLYFPAACTVCFSKLLWDVGRGKSVCEHVCWVVLIPD